MDGQQMFDGNVFLWRQNQLLMREIAGLHERLQASVFEGKQLKVQVLQLQLRVVDVEQKNTQLKQRLADLELKLKSKDPPTPPAFVKANVSSKGRKKPGRKEGHPAALRPMPEKIDVHQDVPLPLDAAGVASCPDCRCQLSDIKHHQRPIEEIVPAKVITTCYHTTSGWCPNCRKRIESRAEEQPPPHNLPHAQLGINALTYAAVMRVCYRLPLRLIKALFQQLPGLKISPGGIAKQLQRLSQWVEGEYHRLKLSLRLAGVVHADETSWRTNGKNGYIWMLTDPTHTLFHIDRSRSGQVIADLLGKAFGVGGKSTLISDFYAAYDQFDCAQQKCLTHLLRELKETSQRRPELARHPLFKKCKRLIKDMLRLKGRRQKLGQEAYAHQVQLVKERLKVLGEQQWDDADAIRIGKRLHKYQNKLTTFLDKAEVDGTNNAAERALRPAVVMRKITGGSRSERGAKAWAILASVMRTAQQQGKDVVATIQTLLKAHWAGRETTLLTDLLMPIVAADTS